MNAALSALRGAVRSQALGQVGLAIVLGALAGACVTAMTTIAEFAHVAIYGIAFDERLSARARVSPLTAVTALALGGLAMGLFEHWRRARKAPAIVDPIEANALRGGRLSLRDGLLVAAQTLISNGCGASVGLEAGYAQIGSAIASRAGVALDLRRQDLRTLVGCGAAGAMAAAFAAPLTGAFYAFELIIGVYSLANAGPVLAAAVAGTLAVRALGGAPYLVTAPPVAAPHCRASPDAGRARPDFRRGRRRRDACGRLVRARLSGKSSAALGASRRSAAALSPRSRR